MKKFIPLILLAISVAAVGFAVYYADTKIDRNVIENSLRGLEPIVLAVIFLSMINLLGEIPIRSYIARVATPGELLSYLPCLARHFGASLPMTDYEHSQDTWK